MDILSRIFGNTVDIWGRNGTLDTGIEEMYSYDQAMDWPTVLAAAAKMDVTSSSAADAAAGAGARTIRIIGLDTDYKLLSEDLTMNGQTIVPTVNSFLRVFGAEVLTAGSGGVNAGDIHIVKTGTGGSYTAGVPGTLTSAICKILTGWGSSMNGLFTVPAGRSYILTHLVVSCRAQAGTFLVQSQDLSLTTPRLITGVPPLEVPAGGFLDLWFDRDDPLFPKGNQTFSFGQKTDIRLRGFAAASSGIASISMALRRST